MSVDQRHPPQQATSAPLAILPRQESQATIYSPESAALVLERVVTMGDLAALQPEERVAYYLDTCQSLGLNPRSRPFDWLLVDNRVVLYPNKSCADQLRALHRIRIEVSPPESSKDGTMLRCEAKGIMPDGRYDTASKYVPITGYTQQRGEFRLRGKDLAHAYMKAETGAKRRVTFSLIGMAAPPQDLDDVQYKVLTVDGRGNILANPTPEQKMLAETPALARVIHEPTFEDMAGEPTIFEGSPVQHPAPDPGPPQPTSERPSFRASEEDIARWQRTWFATVKGLSLDSDAARHAFIAQWTADEWPRAKRTDSLPTLFARCTPEEAEAFLGHVRALMEDERKERLAYSHQNMPDAPSAPAGLDQRVHDAVQLTGGPAGGDDDEPTAF